MKVYRGCPECGCNQVKVDATVRTEIQGRFSDSEFEPGEGSIRDFEVEEVEDFECVECGETFHSPVLVYDVPGPRLRLSLTVEMVHTKPVKGESDEDGGPPDEGCVGRFHAEDLEQDGKSKTFRADIPIASPEAAAMAMEAAKAFFHTMLIKQGQKRG